MPLCRRRRVQPVASSMPTQPSSESCMILLFREVSVCMQNAKVVCTQPLSVASQFRHDTRHTHTHTHTHAHRRNPTHTRAHTHTHTPAHNTHTNTAEQQQTTTTHGVLQHNQKRMTTQHCKAQQSTPHTKDDTEAAAFHRTGDDDTHAGAVRQSRTTRKTKHTQHESQTRHTHLERSAVSDRLRRSVSTLQNPTVA